MTKEIFMRARTPPLDVERVAISLRLPEDMFRFVKERSQRTFRSLNLVFMELVDKEMKAEKKERKE